MAEWNVFADGVDPDLEHQLGDSIREEKRCDCGDLVSSHDRLGCMSRGCECKKTLTTLTFRQDQV